MRREGKKQRGAALLELAMCIPLMAILVMALVDIGQAIWLKQQLQLIAYEGVRYASRLPGLEVNDEADPENADAFRCTLVGNETECAGTVEHTNLNRRINTLLLEKWNGGNGYFPFQSRDCNARRSGSGANLDGSRNECSITRQTGLYYNGTTPLVRVRIEYPYTGLFTRFVNPDGSIVVDVSSVYLINTNNGSNPTPAATVGL